MSGEELRALMSRVPSSVAVITVDANGQRLGLTVGSLVALSLEPPLEIQISALCSHLRRRRSRPDLEASPQRACAVHQRRNRSAAPARRKSCKLVCSE